MASLSTSGFVRVSASGGRRRTQVAVRAQTRVQIKVGIGSVKPAPWCLWNCAAATSHSSSGWCAPQVCTNQHCKNQGSAHVSIVSGTERRLQGRTWTGTGGCGGCGVGDELMPSAGWQGRANPSASVHTLQILQFFKDLGIEELDVRERPCMGKEPASGIYKQKRALVHCCSVACLPLPYMWWAPPCLGPTLCAGNCGYGPNLQIVPQDGSMGERFANVNSPTKAARVLEQYCDLAADPVVVQVCESCCQTLLDDCCWLPAGCRQLQACMPAAALFSSRAGTTGVEGGP